MATLIQRSLGGGELDPSLWARTDTTKYTTGLRTLRNALVRRSGGASSRPGTYKVAAVKDSTKTVRLIEFVFSLTQTYILEFGDLYVRFHQNGAPVTVSGVAAYAGGTAYSIGALVVSGGINYYCIQAGTGHTPASSPLYWYPLTGSIYEIPTPYVYTDLSSLRYAQSNDTITITHPSYAPRELARAGATSWSISQVLYGSTVHPPSGISTVGGTVGGTTAWIVASIDKTTTEEGAIYSDIPGVAGPFSGYTGCAFATSTFKPSAAGPITLSWTMGPTAGAVNIYRADGGSAQYGYIGTATGTSFIDDGITPDVTHQPVQGTVSFFESANTYPSACAYYQQRMCYANTNNNPTRIWGSSTGLYHNFNASFPVLSSDSLSFSSPAARDSVQHLLNLGILISFTAGSETAILGDSSNNALTPASTNPKQQSVHGCSNVRPLVVGEYAVYIQARGSIVRDLGFNFQVDGYRGDDLTVFASHLFDKYTLVDWAYQMVPHSIIWAARSDGTLLGMTYIREQQILAWHRHDFEGGIVENVQCVPEGNEDAVYLVIKRVINGSTVRYIERLSTSQVSDVVDYIGMDCAATFDGRNTTSDTATISGGTLWSETELLTLTISANNFKTFSATDATNNNEVHLTASDGSFIRFKITGYTSATVVTGFVDRTVVVSLRSATTNWSIAVSHLSGLSYLEGKTLSVMGDGYVVGSPNNSDYPTYTVSSGAVVLNDHYSVIHVGLPITTDIETLDIDTPEANGSITNKFKNVQEVTLHLLNSRGVWVGPSNPDEDLTNTTSDPLYRLTEQKIRQYENYDSPVSLVTGKVTQNIQSDWNSNGHVFIRQVDPVPMTVLAIAPDGLFPLKGGG